MKPTVKCIQISLTLEKYGSIYSFVLGDFHYRSDWVSSSEDTDQVAKNLSNQVKTKKFGMIRYCHYFFSIDFPALQVQANNSIKFESNVTVCPLNNYVKIHFQQMIQFHFCFLSSQKTF